MESPQFMIYMLEQRAWKHIHGLKALEDLKRVAALRGRQPVPPQEWRVISQSRVGPRTYEYRCSSLMDLHYAMAFAEQAKSEAPKNATITVAIDIKQAVLMSGFYAALKPAESSALLT
ncbi:hypothetical protein [Schlesneria paludicola]|uniref:hypothetical protein n=1 Tax=Schlesneria paludicola TaxID=360056 RepID=UPI000492CA46|nr:hypothetical protein [Schlesneria paludicola]